MDKWIIILSVIVTGGLWLRFIYKYDSVEPEPIKVVLKIAILGGLCSATLAALVNIISGKILGYSDTGYNSLIKTGIYSMAVGLNEEFMKAYFAYFFTKNLKELDEPIDAVIYSTSVALGFAVIENFLYTISQGFNGGLYTLGVRSFTAMPLHIGLAVLFGVSITRLRFLEEKTYFDEMKKTVLLAAVIHGVYDFILFYFKNPILGLITSLVIAFILIVKMNKTLKYLQGQTPFLPAGTCTNCGIENSPTAKTCLKCGFGLEQEYFIVCPNCATKLPTHFTECSSCGYAVDTKNLYQDKN
ncbi:MAG: PrsW family intramembrane metalloprotease [Leptospiraceae bacterium]|nr:PrsW family intramembrane metalloprotease [Leptospiraceae bacterium]